MKIKAIIASLSLTAMAAGALTVGIVNSNSGKNTSEVHAGDSALVYFNFSEYGQTYDSTGTHTSYSVWAFGSGTESDKFFHASEVNFDIGLYSISCDTSYTKFIAVRAKNGVWDTWPNASVDSYNETATFTRSSSEDYCWVWSSEGNYGDKCTWNKTTGTYLNINGVGQEMSFDFEENQHGVTNLSLTATDSITITRGGSTFGYSNLEDNSLFNEGTSNAFLPKNPSKYAIYVKHDGKIWAQIDSSVEAENWAKGFVQGVGCAAPYNEAPENWDTYAGTFNSLTNGAKDTLIGATASNEEGASYVQQAAFIHDMCVRKYSECDVFMKRDGGGSRSVTPSNTINTVNVDNNALTIIIVSASVITVSLLAAFVLLKKRKESR